MLDTLHQIFSDTFGLVVFAFLVGMAVASGEWGLIRLYGGLILIGSALVVLGRML